MKCLLFDKGYPHPKNLNAFKLGCKLLGYTVEHSHDYSLLQKDYDLIWINAEYITPDKIPNAKRIMYGPQNFVFPEGKWITEKFNDPRCFYNCLSDWVDKLYSEFGELSCEKKARPFGVDIYKFSEKPLIIDSQYRYDCFIYFKSRHSWCLHYATNICDKLNLRYVVLKYGSYNEEQYMNILRNSKFGIWIGSHESQGFAVQEALATNTPLLVWNAKSMFDEYSNDNQSYANYIGKKELKATSVTTWSDDCGIVFYEKEELEENLVKMCEIYRTFNPRKLIVNELEPSKCILRMLA